VVEIFKETGYHIVASKFILAITF